MGDEPVTSVLNDSHTAISRAGRVLFVPGLGSLNITPLFEVDLHHGNFLSEVFRHKRIFRRPLEPAHHHNGILAIFVVLSK